VPREEELFSLIAEWCYYRCRVDVPATVPIIEAMFRQAIHLNQFGFCSLLNAELARFKGALTPAQQDRLDFRTGLVYFRLDEPRLAQELWLKLINFSGIETKLRATTLLMLTELIARSMPDDAIEYGKEAEERYQSFIEQESDPAAQQILIAELGQVYNNLGFAYRVKGDLPTAIHYYELALKHSKRPKNIATTLNNIGYAYFLTGDWVRARVAVGQSLQYREKLQIKHELGLGYNTMGIMLEQIGRTDEANDYYQRALRCFDEFTNRRGRSMVYVNLGRFNRHAKNFDLAFKYLERARKDMTYINDFDQLIIVLNELGCAYRDRNQPGDWTKAEEHLASSLSLARQLGNLRHQADNLEDLSQLYLLWGQEARVEDDTSLADELESKAIDAARQANALAVQLDYHFMKAKVANTFGDIALSKGQTDTAFDHYFGACRAMLDAHLASVGEPLQLQRWTDEIVDNLQKHLSALGTARETQEQANRLLRALDRLSDQEKDHAETLSAMLSMSARVTDTFDAFL
jgi:tetratricopeptide (TPR) repeat protein